MAINFDSIKEGDLFFTRNNSLIGRIIRWCTNSPVQHVGQFIKPFGRNLFYKCEMQQDIGSKHDLKFNPIKGNGDIVSVKRPLLNVYSDEQSRLAFRNRMIKWHDQLTISYDNAELLSHIPILGSKKDRNKKKLICSRLVYVNLCADGCRIKSSVFDEAVTPDDLYDSPYLTEVIGWKV